MSKATDLSRAIDNVHKSFAEVMRELSPRLANIATELAKAIHNLKIPVVTQVLITLAENERDNTPRWRLIKRWKLSRNIAKLKSQL